MVVVLELIVVEGGLRLGLFPHALHYGVQPTLYFVGQEAGVHHVFLLVGLGVEYFAFGAVEELLD